MQMLKPEQYKAIEYLAQVKHGGLTQDEIAEECGVARQTLYRWRKDPQFQVELRVQIANNTMNRLPEVMDAMVESAIKLKSAAAAKLIMQACDMLTDRVEVVSPNKETLDIDGMRAEIERFKRMSAE